MLYILREIKLLLLFSYHVLLRKFKIFPPADFPINIKNGEDGSQKFLEFKNGKDKYFVRPYEKHINFFNILNTYMTKDINMMLSYEIFKLNFVSNKIEQKIENDCLLPIATNIKANRCILKINNKDFNIKLKPNRNYYLNLKKEDNLNIKSKEPIIFGKFIKKNNFDNNKIKLNLVIFIDGLINKVTEDENIFEKIMPNTKKFFSNGINFKNHHSNGEWSYPSAANFFSGLHLQNHKMYHPLKHQMLDDNIKTLAEVFSEENFVTLKFNGNWRMTPTYGLDRGFDRNIYKRGMPATDVISHFKHSDDTFYNTNKFAWLTFFDLHGEDVVTKNKLVTEDLLFEENMFDAFNPKNEKNTNKTKSVFLAKDEEEIKFYYKKCNFLDHQLKILYDYIEEKYSEDEVLINLITDHGVSFIDNDKKLLADKRIRIPWIIKSGKIKNSEKYSNEITENVDIMKTILEINNIDTNRLKLDGNLPKILGGKIKEYSISQSLFPNQSYKCRIDFQKITLFYETKNKVNNNGKLNILDKNLDYNIKDNLAIEEIEEYKKKGETIVQNLFNKTFK